jgi:hypothetical protein
MKKKNHSKCIAAPAADSDPSREEIARLACSMWENAQRPVGRDLEFWLQAEALLRQNHKQVPTSA